MRCRHFAGLIVVALLAVGGWVLAQQKPPGPAGMGGGGGRPAHPAWEYKALDPSKFFNLAPKQAEDKTTEGLNVLGADGWELVAIEPGQRNLYVFKRPKGRAPGVEPPRAAPAPPETRDEITQVFRLKFARAGDMIKLFKELSLDRDGKALRFAGDERTNTVIIIGGEKDLFEVARLLKELDVPGDERAAPAGK